MIGYELANTLDAKVGSTVMVISPQGELTPLGSFRSISAFALRGSFIRASTSTIRAMAFVRLRDAQALFGEPDLVSVISFKVDDMYHADRVGKEIEAAAGPGFLTTNWMEQNRELFRALRLEQVVTFIVIGLIVCVAALNILIALTMMVMEKTRDIAVHDVLRRPAGSDPPNLPDAGISDQRAGHGARAGAGLCSGMARRPLPVHPSVRRGLLDRLSAVRAALDRWGDRGAVSLGVSLLATLYPSRSAARVLPAEALRYE